MIFGYWTTGPRPNGAPPPEEAWSEWKSRFAAYRVFGDDEVLPLLRRWGENAASLFDDICIPACRADVARLALLYEHGGLYVDAHSMPGDPEQLALLLTRLSDWELILFDERPNSERHRQLWILNSVLCAQAQSDLLDELVRRAFANLERHREEERRHDPEHVPYEIYNLTGPWMILNVLFDRMPNGDAELKPCYRDRVLILPLPVLERPAPASMPVYLYCCGDYRKGRLHWSKREKVEPLFRSPIYDRQPEAGPVEVPPTA